MEKKSQVSSSVYTSDFSQKNNSQLERKTKSKPRIKIEIVNQNLEQAIRDVRNHVKENPEWNMNVKKIVEQYKPRRQRNSIINETQDEQLGGNLLPETSKQPPLSSHFQSTRRPDLQKMKYTQRQKREFEQRMQEIKQKRMQLQVNSLQKQMKAKLQKKIKQKLVLKEKAKLVHEILEERQRRMRLRDKMSMKKNEEQSLMHQSNLANVEMIRRCKKRAKKRELNENLSQSELSATDLKFKQFLNQKSKLQKKNILIARYRALRSASQGALMKNTVQKPTVQKTQSTKHL